MIEEVGIPVAILIVALAAFGWFFWYVIKTKWPEEIKNARADANLARVDAKEAREELKAERLAMEQIRLQVREEYLTNLEKARQHFDAMLEKIEKREDERLGRVITAVEALTLIVKERLDARQG
jgi:F0F1-type ATP synthase membrane subunit b/b'